VANLSAACAVSGAKETLWRALLDAVAYGGDREAFRRLAAAFSPALAQDLTRQPPADAHHVLEQALLAVAGLAAPPASLSNRLPPPIRPPPRAGSRPAGRPEKRIAAFARLYERAAGDFEAYVSRTVREAAKGGELVAAWQVPGLGRDRAIEIAVNVVLPFAAADTALAEKATSLLPGLAAAAPYGKTAFLEHNLRGPDGRRAVQSALAQQGLLSLLADWCSQGGCGRCPLS
jgi:hypothetical protein